MFCTCVYMDVQYKTTVAYMWVNTGKWSKYNLHSSQSVDIKTLQHDMATHNTYHCVIHDRTT